MLSHGSMRRATAADSSALRRLVAELGYGGLDDETFAAGFAAVLADPSQQVWVAHEGARLIGLMTLSTRPQLRLGGAVMTIDELVVTESARGAGVGRQLLEMAKLEAVRAGARRLDLQTGRSRVSYERGFYRKNGFIEVDSALMRWQPVTS
jgi:PhnO protein